MDNEILAAAERHKLMTAAIIGGAVAATAGAAFLGSKALAKRGGDKGVNAAMANAITASGLEHKD